jgi:Fe2+ transport system protein FeoA
VNASELKKGQRAVILRVNGNDSAQRLLEMGFFPGTEILSTGKGPFGNPLAFRVGQLHAALRKEEAAMIEITEREGNP